LKKLSKGTKDGEIYAEFRSIEKVTNSSLKRVIYKKVKKKRICNFLEKNFRNCLTDQNLD
jgi:hypothetical protein